MAGRIRSIKPEIIEDARSAGLSSDAWRLWVCMWLLADDFGNLRADPRRLTADIFWACPHKVKADELLIELEQAEVIRRYSVRGQQYVSISNWDKHQRVDNAGKPRVPGPNEADEKSTGCESPRIAANRGWISDHDQRPTPRGEAPRFSFDDFWREYPRKVSKASAEKAFGKQVTSQTGFDALMAAIPVYRAYLKRTNTEEKFIAHPATFINGKWRDYPPTSSAGTPGRISAVDRAVAAETAARLENERRNAQETDGDATVSPARLGRGVEAQGSGTDSEPGRGDGMESRGMGDLFDGKRIQGTAPDSKPDPYQCMGGGYGRGHEAGDVATPRQSAPGALQGGRNETGVSSLLECERRNSDPLERNSAGSSRAVLWC